MTTATVGVIGLGAMGAGIAATLRTRGHALRVCDARAGVAEGFAQAGGTACAHPAEVAAGCEIVVSVVVNAQQTEAVLFGDHGAAAAMRPGSVFVMCSRSTRTGPCAWRRAWPSSACCISMRRSPAAPPRPPAGR